jgi:2-polyprenyl-6-methoxyphenol hydroxylase-like FAD-dependent oxidoreductase
MKAMKPEASSVRNNSFTIMGGGIAGLTTALALKNIGIRATVFEAASEFRAVGAGITLASNAMKAMRLLGMEEELMAAGNPIRAFEICDEKGKTISSQQSFAGDQDNTALLAIHRADLHGILLSGLDGDQLMNGKRLVSMQKMSEETELTFDDGTVHRSRYLVAADGIHSRFETCCYPGRI